MTNAIAWEESKVSKCFTLPQDVIATGTSSDFHGKAITVQSATGPENSIIDCEGEGRGFLFQNGEDQRSVVLGFTIQNCYATGIEGAGIHVASTSSPLIKNNHIKNCDGWGIGLVGSSPIVEGNTLMGNKGGGSVFGEQNRR